MNSSTSPITSKNYFNQKLHLSCVLRCILMSRSDEFQINNNMIITENTTESKTNPIYKILPSKYAAKY